MAKRTFDEEFMDGFGFRMEGDELYSSVKCEVYQTNYPVNQREIDYIIENLTMIRGNGDFENEVAELQYDLQMAKDLLQDAKEYIQLLTAQSTGEMN